MMSICQSLGSRSRGNSASLCLALQPGAVPLQVSSHEKLSLPPVSSLYPRTCERQHTRTKSNSTHVLRDGTNIDATQMLSPTQQAQHQRSVSIETFSHIVDFLELCLLL